MAAEKSISMSFRVSPKFKALVAVTAVCENRSLTNMLETPVLAHWKTHGRKAFIVAGDKPKGAKT